MVSKNAVHIRYKNDRHCYLYFTFLDEVLMISPR